MQLLRFGYCTRPYCDFDNILINCSALTYMQEWQTKERKRGSPVFYECVSKVASEPKVCQFIQVHNDQVCQQGSERLSECTCVRVCDCKSACEVNSEHEVTVQCLHQVTESHMMKRVCKQTTEHTLASQKSRFSQLMKQADWTHVLVNGLCQAEKAAEGHLPYSSNKNNKF